MEEIVVKGITKDIARILGIKSLFFKRFILIYLDVRIIIIISMIFIINRIGIVEAISFLLFLLSSDISLDREIGAEKEARLIKSINVGNISIYILIPFVPIILDITILIIKLKILVIKLPINNIRVDLTNLFFIINFMNFYKKIYHI